MNILVDYPAFTVLDGKDLENGLYCNNDKGYCKLCDIPIVIKAFPKDKYEYIRSFTIGWDYEDGHWAYGNGAMITAEKQAKGVKVGFELGDEITLDGKTYTIEPDHNHNIKFVEV